MIWDNFSIFRTNCTIVCGTRAYMLRRFLRACCAGKMASEIPEIFYTFGPLHNTFISVGILLKYFRRKLLQFEGSKTVSNLGISRFISLTRLCCTASFTRTSHYSTLNFTYVELEINSFSLVQQKTSWIYLDIAAFQDFKVFLLLPHAFEDLATEKLKKIITLQV